MILPVAVILAGVLFGRLAAFPAVTAWVDPVITVSLGVVVLCAGLDVGAKRTVFRKLREYGPRILLLPLGTAAGTLLGGAVAGWLLSIPLHEAAAVSAGFGWYSLSVGMFANLGASHLAATAFLANVFRELFTFLCIPPVARYLGPLTAIAPGGATTMDVTLPIIARYASEEITVMALIHGVVLTMLVPLLVPLLYNLG